MFGPESGLDPHELRRRAKIINYALLYGKTAFTLAKDIGVTQQAAQAFIDAYFAGFPRVRGFIDQTIATARATGVVKTMFGRRRLVPELTSRNGQVRVCGRTRHRQHADPGNSRRHPEARDDRRARCHPRPVRPSGPAGRMILTVHDELLFEVPRERADELSVVIREQMEQAATLAVPLTVDVGVGDNWKTRRDDADFGVRHAGWGIRAEFDVRMFGKLGSTDRRSTERGSSAPVTLHGTSRRRRLAEAARKISRTERATAARDVS